MASHTVRIKRMYWNNVRNFEEISLPPSQDEDLSSSHTSLVQIQNNYGKTSTMWLLRSVFTGMKVKLSELEGYAYRYPKDQGWGGDPNGKIEFSVSLSLDGELCELGTTIDPLSEKQKFYTFYPDLGGREDGWNPPSWFKRIFADNIELCSLYILDGELAGELNTTVGKEVLSAAIRQVSNITEVCDLVDNGPNKGKISLILDELVDALGKRHDKDTKLIKRRDERLLPHIKKIEKQRDDDKEELDIQKASLKKLNTVLDAHEGRMLEGDDQLTEANEDLIAARRQLKDTVVSAMKEIYYPQNVLPISTWNKVDEFYREQSKAKLPRSMSQNFFDEIQDDPTCICGTKWDKAGEMKKWLGENKENYLQEGLMARVMGIQNAIKESGISEFTHSGVIKSTLDAARTRKRECESLVKDLQNRGDQDALAKYKQLLDEKGLVKNDVEEAEYKYMCHASEDREFIKENALDEFTRTKDGITIQPDRFIRIINLHELRKVEANMNDEILAMSESAQIKDGAKIVSEVLSVSIARLMQQIEADLNVKINAFAEKIQALEVKIVLDDSSIRYVNPAGRWQKEVSESGKLGAMYAVVSAMNQYADVSLPIVVDTPLAGYGAKMSQAWAEVVPPNFGQVIALINGNEKKALRFWWMDENQRKRLSFYTFLRQNEVVKTASDPDGGKTTGPMHISDSYQDFALYETHISGFVEYGEGDI